MIYAALMFIVLAYRSMWAGANLEHFMRGSRYDFDTCAGYTLLSILLTVVAPISILCFIFMKIGKRFKNSSTFS